MKKCFLITVVMLVALSLAGHSFAFSTDSKNNQQSDGTPKFVDPDEKMPAFMVSPDNNTGDMHALSFGSPGATLPTIQDSDSGAQAFNRAIVHQENK